jgi:hypothetical protein
MYWAFWKIIFTLDTNKNYIISNIKFIFKNNTKITNLALSFIDYIENIEYIDRDILNIYLEEELIDENLSNIILIECKNQLNNLSYK